MAKRTQIRVSSITGSFSTSQINDQITAAATGSISGASLEDVLSHLAGAVKRIHGSDSFSEASAGVFSQDVQFNKDVKIVDDSDLVFGTNSDAKFKYDEAGNDVLEYSGANFRIKDDTKLEFGDGGDATIEYDEDGDDVLQIAGSNVRIGHGANTELQFRDSALKISSSTDGQLDIDADGEIEISTAELDIDATAGINITSSENANDAVVINANHANGRIRLQNQGSTIMDVRDGRVDVAQNLRISEDNKALQIGAGQDLQMSHNASSNNNSLIVNSTGDLTIQNSVADKEIKLVLGSDNDNTALTVRNNSSNKLLTVKGGGQVTVSNNLLVSGDLVVAGTTTAITSSNTVIQDAIIGIGISGSVGYAPDGQDVGIIFGQGAIHSAQRAFFYDDSLDSFVLGSSITSPTSSSFTPVTDGNLSALQLGQISFDPDNSEKIASDGTDMTVTSGGKITLDSATAVELDSASGDITFMDAGTAQLALDLDGTAGEIIMQLKVDSDDFVFKQYDGTEVFRVEDDGAFDIAGGAGSSGVTITAAGQLTADGRVIVDDATDATSTTDGSLQTDGGLSVAKDVVAGNDVKLLSDAAVLSFGAGSDVTFTHDNGTGMDIVSAGDLDLSSTAGSATLTVVDGQSVTIGKASHNSIVVTPHNTAGSELILIQNVSGDTDGADQAGAIEIDAQAGGISLNAANNKKIFAQGGKVELKAEANSTFAINLEANGGTDETIAITSVQGNGAQAIAIDAAAGGVVLKAGLDNAAALFLSSSSGVTIQGGDENDSIFFEDAPLKLDTISAPSSTTGKLYNLGGDLFWSGNRLSGADRAILKITDTVASGTQISTAGYSDNTSALLATDGISTENASNPILTIDVYVNGQLLLSGSDVNVGTSDADYLFNSTGSITFGFGLEQDDLIQIISR